VKPQNQESFLKNQIPNQRKRGSSEATVRRVISPCSKKGNPPPWSWESRTKGSRCKVQVRRPKGSKTGEKLGKNRGSGVYQKRGNKKENRSRIISRGKRSAGEVCPKPSEVREEEVDEGHCDRGQAYGVRLRSQAFKDLKKGIFKRSKRQGNGHRRNSILQERVTGGADRGTETAPPKRARWGGG